MVAGGIVLFIGSLLADRRRQRHRRRARALSPRSMVGRPNQDARAVAPGHRVAPAIGGFPSRRPLGIKNLLRRFCSAVQAALTRFVEGLPIAPLSDAETDLMESRDKGIVIVGAGTRLDP
jgi:hypothetical protein